ncbi:MAG: HypC/HybG/HupF family hydrogenase formation chaperone [Christensenella sp.]|uniref:HypC/HybG/HupF family hydrogenase formation chaperone n=1 Tax=Christensenella sp. TaxID=1935934 RepID=UPI002B20ECDD|nr:HypC/HybG/HupF family hydrogenase formation chaperone [Christensenella sp.]MEA5004048.1 HypC/HybG/HupF family hydrogenase formation chaperone [Christensenella sp.]
MCVATSGKVVSIEGTTATVDFHGNLITARAGLVKIQPGDYVLVHAGCILQKLKQEEHESIQELFAEIEDL